MDKSVVQIFETEFFTGCPNVTFVEEVTFDGPINTCQ